MQRPQTDKVMTSDSVYERLAELLLQQEQLGEPLRVILQAKLRSKSLLGALLTHLRPVPRYGERCQLHVHQYTVQVAVPLLRHGMAYRSDDVIPEDLLTCFLSLGWLPHTLDRWLFAPGLIDCHAAPRSKLPRGTPNYMYMYHALCP